MDARGYLQSLCPDKWAGGETLRELARVMLPMFVSLEELKSVRNEGVLKVISMSAPPEQHEQWTPSSRPSSVRMIAKVNDLNVTKASTISLTSFRIKITSG
jgi:hypothetical protein